MCKSSIHFIELAVQIILSDADTDKIKDAINENNRISVDDGKNSRVLINKRNEDFRLREKLEESEEKYLQNVECVDPKSTMLTLNKTSASSSSSSSSPPFPSLHVSSNTLHSFSPPHPHPHPIPLPPTQSLSRPTFLSLRISVLQNVATLIKVTYVFIPCLQSSKIFFHVASKINKYTKIFRFAFF